MTDKEIRLLMQSDAWPEAPEQVRLIQTHTSWVLLTGKRAYKIKKPVFFGFLDYTSLDARKYFCEEELRLNRRLSPDIYLGMKPVIAAGIGGPGSGIRVGLPIPDPRSPIPDPRFEVIDYCLEMIELPQDAMMSEKLQKKEVTYAMIDEIAQTVAEFHQAAATDPDISKFGDLETVKFNWDENFAQTEEFRGRTISQRMFGRIRQIVDRFLTQNSTLLKERILEGRIRECHGDLHSRNIFILSGAHGLRLTPEKGLRLTAYGSRPGIRAVGRQPSAVSRQPSAVSPDFAVSPDSAVRIFDCIEFNRRFSCCDVASEIAFFVMDLEYCGEKGLATYFVDRYLHLTRDYALLKMLDFYKCYRAYVRGKVISFVLNDPGVPPGQKQDASKTARKYFRLAAHYAESLDAAPTLILMMGLPGVGKTFLAERLAQRLNCYHIRSDIVRKELMALPVGRHAFQGMGTGIYSSAISAHTYEEMHQRAAAYLAAGRTVILDATFSFESGRQEARAIAERLNARFLMVNCVCPVKVALMRIAQRTHEFSFSDATPEVYYHIRQTFQPVKKTKHLVTANTIGSMTTLLRRIEAALKRL